MAAIIRIVLGLAAVATSSCRPAPASLPHDWMQVSLTPWSGPDHGRQMEVPAGWTLEWPREDVRGEVHLIPPHRTGQDAVTVIAAHLDWSSQEKVATGLTGNAGGLGRLPTRRLVRGGLAIVCVQRAPPVTAACSRRPRPGWWAPIAFVSKMPRDQFEAIGGLGLLAEIVARAGDVPPAE